MTDRLTIYYSGVRIPGVKGLWRWRLQSGGNWQTIGASTEAYSERAYCIANAARVLDLTADLGGDGSITSRQEAPDLEVVIQA